jgi:hypothetical protein
MSYKIREITNTNIETELRVEHANRISAILHTHCTARYVRTLSSMLHTQIGNALVPCGGWMFHIILSAKLRNYQP